MIQSYRFPLGTMQNLLLFFLRWRPWMLFAIYVIVSCALLFSSNPYQQSVYLTSANSVSAGIYGMASKVSAYFNLLDINEDLQQRNSHLEQQLLELEARLQLYKEKEIALDIEADSTLSRFDFIVAHVINNSISRPHNFITINKGSADGIKPEMGVVDQNGVVGKINVVGEHSSRIISLLNSDLRISSKVRGSEQVGSLVWNGDDSRYAILEELPRHSTFNVGDTVVTSGYSTTFPEGVPVGIVDAELKDYDENFYTLRVRLFTDFSKLSMVRVIIDNMADELRIVEQDNIEPSASDNLQ